MNKKFRNLSIHKKLVLIVVLTSIIAMGLSTIAILVWQEVSLTRFMVKELGTTADILGANGTAALRFNADQDAKKILSSLTAKNHIVGARFYNDKKELFTEYSKEESSKVFSKSPLEEGYVFTFSRVVLVKKIFHDGDFIGIIEIVSNLDELYDHLIDTLFTAFLIISICSFLASWFSLNFLKVISNPISNLVNITTQVSNNKNYSLRAEIFFDDELGKLTKEFNNMLRQIQLRDLDLQNTHSELEKRFAEQKVSEGKIKHFAAELGRSNKDLEHFAHIASHDLQEPLRKISIFSDRLLEQSESLSDTQKDYLKRMQNAASRMQTLIVDLLELAQITTKGQPFQKVDLSKIALEVLDDLETKIHQTRGQVDIDNLPQVEADPFQMRQLLQNLVGNALKYHKKDSCPHVQLSSSFDLKEGWSIHVKDNGIGLNEKYSNRIFAPLERLHGKSDYEGTGIGLAICKNIVVRHGGVIFVTSQEDKGATFTFTLPKSQVTDE